MVGDRLEDEKAAKNAGIDFLSADIWRFSPTDCEF
jgi:phosphoglycolate phosphatase-like HAD superfamily hydrolase